VTGRATQKWLVRPMSAFLERAVPTVNVLAFSLEIEVGGSGSGGVG